MARIPHGAVQRRRPSGNYLLYATHFNSFILVQFEISIVNLDYELISALYAVEYCTRATIIVVGLHDEQTNDDTDHSIGDYETYLEYLNLVGCWNEANREEKYNVSSNEDHRHNLCRTSVTATLDTISFTCNADLW